MGVYMGQTKVNDVSVRDRLNDAILSRLASAKVASTAFRLIFFAGAAAVAGVCQYTTWPVNSPPTTSQVVGICATIVVFLAAMVSILTDKDATSELDCAQRAMHAAEQLQERIDQSLRLWPDVETMVALHNSIMLMRDNLESACASAVVIDDLLSKMLTSVERTLPAAARFTYSDPWTICLYKAQETSQGSGRYELVLVEHLRAIKCEKSSARAWPEGKGVSGIAFTNASEIQIPDMTETSAVALYNSAGVGRQYDHDRYRSMVVVPILVRGMTRPWGVVAATSSNVGHFNHEFEDGLKPIEAIRAVSRYAALAVAMDRASPAVSSPSGQP